MTLHNKEKELLAVLGLILSIGLWLVSMFYTYPQISQSTNPSVGSNLMQSTSKQTGTANDSEIIAKLKDDAKAYCDSIMTNLVVKHDYKTVYEYFDPATKQKYFDNNVNKGISVLKGFVGYLGVASSFNITPNTQISNRKDMMTVYYMVRYNKENDDFVEAAVELYVKISDNKFSLIGVELKPI